jgi:hypothetical protein
MPTDKINSEEIVNRNRHYLTVESELVDEIAAAGIDALSIWIYLINRSENWVIKPTQVQDALGIGRRRYSTAMASLRDIGVIQVTAIRNENGAFGGKIVTVTNYKPNIPEAVPSVTEPTADGSAADRTTADRSVDSSTVPKPVGTLPNDRVIPNYSETPNDRVSEGQGKHQPLLKPDKQKLPGLGRFKREVNYTGQLAPCGPKNLESVWHEIDGEQHADTIIENINLHLAAGTWKSKDDYRTPINHVLANLLWLHPPDQQQTEDSEREKRRQVTRERRAAVRREMEGNQ